jgi:hypothetical protein
MYPELDPLADLEHLVGLAFELKGRVETREHGHLWQSQAIAAFGSACLVGDAVLRLQPESCFYLQSAQVVWNPTATAALTRVLLEAAVNTHYFGDDAVTEDERELRAIVAVIHFLRERQDTAVALQATRPPEPPVPDDWTGVPLQRYPALMAQLKREQLPAALASWEKQLSGNPALKQRPERVRTRWLLGTGLYAKGRYLGGERDAGFTMGRHQRARLAGVSGPAYRALHRHLSAYVHIAPHALDQARWFFPGDGVALVSQIRMPLAVCAGCVALAVEGLLKAFPELREPLDGSRAALLNIGRQYLRCFGPR